MIVVLAGHISPRNCFSLPPFSCFGQRFNLFSVDLAEQFFIVFQPEISEKSGKRLWPTVVDVPDSGTDYPAGRVRDS
jgi:hypothetical protein